VSARWTGETDFCDLAVRACAVCCEKTAQDGAWVYGAAANQAWVDNFHTGYVLQSLSRVMNSCAGAGSLEFGDALERGYKFWRARFFLADGWPKYYDDALYPADNTLGRARSLRFWNCGIWIASAALAENIAAWLLNNMRDSRGFFYYQRKRFTLCVRLSCAGRKRGQLTRWRDCWKNVVKHIVDCMSSRMKSSRLGRVACAAGAECTQSKGGKPPSQHETNCLESSKSLSICRYSLENQRCPLLLM